MQVTFYGAAQTVTGSKHLLEVNGQRILLDCGMFQGRRAEMYEKNQHLPFDASSIDLMILSHAHIDHSGSIPNLVKSGFRGDILATSATRDLCATMLLDSGHIQERDVEFVNKRRKKRGEPPVEPIYTQEDATESLKYFVSMDYDRTRKIASGVSLTFYDAGHMLGSAIVALDIDDQETGNSYRLVFSGDLGRRQIPILRDPTFIDGCDYLIMESTYGDRLHDPYPDAEKELETVINSTFKRGGSVVMPAFAVGRTQQIVYTLHKLSEAGDIPRMPIYVDSPLAVNATSVFALHPEVYDKEAREFMGEADTRNVFGFQDLTYITDVADSKRLNFAKEPCVIISASGMAEFGRVLHHLKNRIEDSRNTVLITGWQAPNTLGRRLLEKQAEVNIFGEPYTLKADVVVLNGFSGHADRDELLEWVETMSQRPRKVFLVHGEPEPAQAFAETLQRQLNLNVTIPDEGQTFKLV